MVLRLVEPERRNDTDIGFQQSGQFYLGLAVQVMKDRGSPGVRYARLPSWRAWRHTAVRDRIGDVAPDLDIDLHSVFGHEVHVKASIRTPGLDRVTVWVALPETVFDTACIQEVSQAGFRTAAPADAAPRPVKTHGGRQSDRFAQVLPPAPGLEHKTGQVSVAVQSAPFDRGQISAVALWSPRAVETASSQVHRGLITPPTGIRSLPVRILRGKAKLLEQIGVHQSNAAQTLWRYARLDEKRRGKRLRAVFGIERPDLVQDHGTLIGFVDLQPRGCLDCTRSALLQRS